MEARTNEYFGVPVTVEFIFTQSNVEITSYAFEGFVVIGVGDRCVVGC